ncbi:hypothetical protein AG1IA_05144 [Rhizoctonia solani AG-1 IA]|uniref:Uncharacterized protein n=1 Tax=Thanatephorus cucumeris (strain AG1-IA) TaxID=983506 RepID=L8WVK0_THACA|nr:hypothetical protein AG1IA_05144 [Rhizoctonia solani AG-1 IA]
MNQLTRIPAILLQYSITMHAPSEDRSLSHPKFWGRLHIGYTPQDGKRRKPHQRSGTERRQIRDS